MNNGINIKEHFTVPKGYFEELHCNIMAQIDSMPDGLTMTGDAKDSGSKKTVFTQVWRMAAAAAVLVLVVLSATVFFYDGETKVAENVVVDTSATVVSPEIIIAESATSGTEIVTVKKEAIAEMPKPATPGKPARKAVKVVKSNTVVSAHEVEDNDADMVDEYLMIDGQMLHQMIISEM